MSDKDDDYKDIRTAVWLFGLLNGVAMVALVVWLLLDGAMTVGESVKFAIQEWWKFFLKIDMTVFIVIMFIRFDKWVAGKGRKVAGMSGKKEYKEKK
jgi:succinate dehydrogenase hydrophobic anchor subunit